MDMAMAAVAGTAAQGDLADVVARAGAMATAPASLHPSPPPAAAADHIMSSSAPPLLPGQIMAAPPYYEDDAAEPRRPALMFEAPYLPSSSSSATAPHAAGYWPLPPEQQLAVHQISQHACYGPDVAMATDVDGDEAGAIRISPAAHHQIMKRKNEVKKVVCIPALPPTSSRPGGGEVIPSDLWAWRKYGQKPIKGSPYPRGYYRCSSSKGCMARKQVERSRSDPNMLVITYTAEHNHPWPMQRNVLAGYSRPHTHTPTNCKKKNSCRVVDPTTSSSSTSKNGNHYSRHSAVVASGNLECQQTTTTDMMGGDAGAGYVAYTVGALDEEGVAMHQPMSFNSIQPPADEVFAELGELEPSNLVDANIYDSRGVSYDWHKF